MQLPEIAIRRPVFATVLSLLVVLVGVVSFDRLSVREYPKIDEPVVTVTTRYPGASAEVIESQISKPLLSLNNRMTSGFKGSPAPAQCTRALGFLLSSKPLISPRTS